MPQDHRYFHRFLSSNAICFDEIDFFLLDLFLFRFFVCWGIVLVNWFSFSVAKVFYVPFSSVNRKTSALNSKQKKISLCFAHISIVSSSTSDQKMGTFSSSIQK